MHELVSVGCNVVTRVNPLWDEAGARNRKTLELDFKEKQSEESENTAGDVMH
jgi:hypothetical protein